MPTKGKKEAAKEQQQQQQQKRQSPGFLSQTVSPSVCASEVEKAVQIILPSHILAEEEEQEAEKKEAQYRPIRQGPGKIGGMAAGLIPFVVVVV